MHVYKFFAAFVRSFPYPISSRAVLGGNGLCGVGEGAQTMRAADYIEEAPASVTFVI
jgi:hypothetical protein